MKGCGLSPTNYFESLYSEEARAVVTTTDGRPYTGTLEGWDDLGIVIRAGEAHFEFAIIPWANITSIREEQE